MTKNSGFALASYEQFITYTNNDGCPGIWMVILIWLCGPTSFKQAYKYPYALVLSKILGTKNTKHLYILLCITLLRFQSC